MHSKCFLSWQLQYSRVLRRRRLQRQRRRYQRRQHRQHPFRRTHSKQVPSPPTTSHRSLPFKPASGGITPAAPAHGPRYSMTQTAPRLPRCALAPSLRLEQPKPPPAGWISTATTRRMSFALPFHQEVITSGSIPTAATRPGRIWQ